MEHLVNQMIKFQNYLEKTLWSIFQHFGCNIDLVSIDIVIILVTTMANFLSSLHIKDLKYLDMENLNTSYIVGNIASCRALCKLFFWILVQD